MARILIDDEISEWYGISSESINKKLNSATGDITVEISSPGGDVFEGIRIYNLLKNYSKGEVTTVIMSMAASIAGYIFLAGDKRKVYGNSTFMKHNASSGAWGDYRVLGDRAEFLKGVTFDLLAPEFMNKSGKTFETEREELDAETWYFGGKSIVDAGYATELIADEEVNNRIDKVENKSQGLEKVMNCSLKNAKACAENSTEDSFTENMEYVRQLIGESPNQPQGETMDIKDVLTFASSASDEDKAQLKNALGDNTEALSNKVADLESQLASAKEEKVTFSQDTAKASVKTIVATMNDEKFSNIPMEDRLKALDSVVLNADGSVDENSQLKMENTLLKETFAQTTPQGGQHQELQHNDGDDIDETAQNMAGKL